MSSIFIAPGDVWLFRDGRPFSAGADRRAQSIFPPFPSVTAGMVRTTYLLENDVDLKAYAGYRKDKDKDNDTVRAIGSPDDDDYGSLRLRGPYVAVRETKDGKANFTRYYPAPADLFTVMVGEDIDHFLLPDVLPLAGELGQGATVNWPEGEPPSHLLWLQESSDDERKVEAAQGWLAEAELQKYLKGDNRLQLTRGSQLFQDDNRLGIAIEGATKATQEGMLYTVNFTSPTWDMARQVGLSLNIEGIAWPDAGVVTLGGERRVGIYGKADAAASNQKPSGPRLRVYFATPAYFKSGWQPNWSDFFAGDPKLAAAAVGIPLTRAGFSLAAQNLSAAHKAARRYVPAGSVYYLESKDGKSLKLKDDLINGAVSEYGREIGFGQVFIGEWQSGR